VQNSIDAGARRIEISRLRERGVTALHVVDDGEGVIPELDRVEALTYIATHIGHSRKRNLTPQQRRELMMQGKYGIGLLGFWSIGQMLEMRTQIPAQPAQLLRLFEDSPRYEIERARSRLSFGDRYTEIVVRSLHRSAFLNLSARRIADYLAAELRGQLLSRDLSILVRDRIARGRAPKVLEVQPARFSGQRLALPAEIPVQGFAPIRIEIYLRPPGGAEEGQVSISSGGTIVYDEVAQLDAADFHHPPWLDHRLCGLVEFPDFEVSPGTRRGVFPNQAAFAFAAALRSVEPAILEQVKEAEARTAAALEADVLRQLEKAFRDLPRLAPEYDFFAVRAHDSAPLGGAPGDGRGEVREPEPEGGAPPPDGVAMPEPGGEEAAPEQEMPSLLPPGPLATLQIVPAVTRVERLGERRLRADARDASGTRIDRALEIEWTAGALGHLDPTRGAVVVFHAGPDTGTVEIAAVARENGAEARAASSIRIVEASAAEEARRAGIPEPIFVDDPNGSWRSRMRDEHWEVNSAHPDFGIASEAPRRKLRYLVTLLAKEVVLHSFPSPQLGPALERLVEVMTIADRRLEKT